MSLRNLREEKGMTQTKLVQSSGIKQSTISQYENGLRIPSLKNAKKLSDALEVPLGDIFLLFNISQ